MLVAVEYMNTRHGGHGGLVVIQLLLVASFPCRLNLSTVLPSMELLESVQTDGF